MEESTRVVRQRVLIEAGSLRTRPVQPPEEIAIKAYALTESHWLASGRLSVLTLCRDHAILVLRMRAATDVGEETGTFGGSRGARLFRKNEQLHLRVGKETLFFHGS